MAETEGVKTRVTSVLEDPSAQAIARIYADSFLQAAQSSDVEELLEEFASFLDDVLGANPEFERLLCTGLLNRDDKLAILERVIAPRGSDLFTNFLRVLARHDRLELLPLILGETQLKHEELTGRKRVRVTSAVELSSDMQAKVRQQLSERFSFEPILETEINPSLIGGLVIQIGDTVYDSSIQVRMKQLRDQLRQRSLHEIQSGRDRFSHPEGD